MKEKKRDKNIVKEAIGDPAFYNDQIDAKGEPARKLADDKKQRNCKNGL